MTSSEEERRKPQDLSFLDGLIEGRDYATIPLTQNQVAVVDVADWRKLKHLRFYAQWKELGQNYYARSLTKNEDGTWDRTALHRLLLSPKPGFVVDHRNAITLDNRRANLRVASIAENNRNRRASKNGSSRYLGVSWHSRVKKWCVQLKHGGTNKHIGYFTLEIDAARAYDRASIEHHKEFGNTNFPREEYA